jgi:hypothetical protein
MTSCAQRRSITLTSRAQPASELGASRCRSAARQPLAELHRQLVAARLPERPQRPDRRSTQVMPARRAQAVGESPSETALFPNPESFFVVHVLDRRTPSSRPTRRGSGAVKSSGSYSVGGGSQRRLGPQTAFVHWSSRSHAARQPP